ncbi:hypothetical protein HYU45_00655 [Candidatus Daviesbacteria bacterium]|nr:hypothetical protein [Candidatus Daviesbacteria bacterium]
MDTLIFRTSFPMEENNKLLLSKGKKYNFLFDTSTILYFQEMHKYCGASIFKAIEECPDVTFFVLNDVLSELMQGSKAINPTQLGSFLNHILNVESSMDRSRKENRFLISEDGEIKYIVLNSISATDYAQILVCQNHPQLTLVANDKKMIKSAAQVIKGRRTLGIPSFLDRLLVLYPDNERLKVLKKTGDELFVKKHAFGNISEDKFNETVKLRK